MGFHLAAHLGGVGKDLGGWQAQAVAKGSVARPLNSCAKAGITGHDPASRQGHEFPGPAFVVIIAFKRRRRHGQRTIGAIGPQTHVHIIDPADFVVAH